ncbi:hypothetical protein GS528_07445 [Rhodococcus hoagii]|nr:hypothetical protein [Prescottella equi]
MVCLATLTSPLAAITASGVLLLATPLLLPRRADVPDAPTGRRWRDSALRRGVPASPVPWLRASMASMDFFN